MPILPMLPVLQTQLQLALSKGPAASSPVVGAEILNAVAAAAGTGLLPTFPPLPVVPAGLPAAISFYNTTLNASPPDVGIAAVNLANAIVMIAPMVPPIGLPILQTQLDLSLRKGQAANVSLIAQEWANAFITYYTSAGVI